MRWPRRHSIRVRLKFVRASIARCAVQGPAVLPGRAEESHQHFASKRCPRLPGCKACRHLADAGQERTAELHQRVADARRERLPAQDCREHQSRPAQPRAFAKKTLPPVRTWKPMQERVPPKMSLADHAALSRITSAATRQLPHRVYTNRVPARGEESTAASMAVNPGCAAGNEGTQARFFDRPR